MEGKTKRNSLLKTKPPLIHYNVMSTDVVTKNRIVEIRAQRFSIDWVYENVHKIDLDNILGFELHYRGGSWHICVVTKEKSDINNVYSPYYSYDLDHWVFPQEAQKLLNNPDITILKIVNGWSIKDFKKALSQLFQN